MHKNWFEQCELVWTSTHSQFEPVWSSWLHCSCKKLVWAVWTVYTHTSLNFAPCTKTDYRTGLSSLNQFSQPALMSPWTAHAQPVRTGLWTSLNQFPQQVWTSLISLCMEIDDNLHYAAHAQKLVRTGFSNLNQFSHPVWTGLNQFGPVWTSFNCFLWQSTLHCSCTTNKNWFEQCELVWTSTHSQFEPVWSS